MATISANAQSGNVLILLGHPNMEESNANRAMIEAVKNLGQVKVMDVYAEEFTADSYRQAVRETSTLVLQFPFYWASAPSGMKR